MRTRHATSAHSVPHGLPLLGEVREVALIASALGVHCAHLMSRTSNTASSTAPSRIGPWRVVGELQHWHRSVTYAVSSQEQGLAALEVFNAPAIKFGSYTERLRKVMQGANRVDHPGALAIYDVGTLGDGRPYMIREVLDGTTLRARAADGLSPKYAISILQDICDVLAAAHRVGVVHDGLELGHVVLVNRELDPSLPRLKLIDWGVAAAILEEAKRSASVGAREPFVPRHPATTDDIYALGVMVHQMFDPIPRGLDSVWLAMLSENPVVRPSIFEVSKRLAELPHSPRPFVTKPYPIPRLASGTEPPPMREMSVAQTLYTSSPSLIIPAATTREPHSVSASGEIATIAPRRAEQIAVPIAEDPVITAQQMVAVAVSNLKPREAVEAKAPIAVPPARALCETLDEEVVEPPRRRRRWPMAFLAVACAAPVAYFALGFYKRPEHVVAKPAAIVAPKARVVATPKVEAPKPVTEAPNAVIEAPKRVAVAPKPVTEAPKPVKKPKPVAEPKRVAKAPAQTVEAPTRQARPAKPKADERSALLAQYQRTGHSLLKLERQFGRDAIADLRERFAWIKIDTAMATTTSRQLVATTLRDLQQQIQSKYAQECKRAPDATGCR